MKGQRQKSMSEKKLRLYLDMCVFNRPFDDQSQSKIMIEAQIFIMLMAMISEGLFILVNSFALEYENSKNPSVENMMKISDFLEYTTDYIHYSEDILERSLEFEKWGLSGMDAVHIACAEKAKADFFLTCDDRLIKKLQRVDDMEIACYNIIDFISKEVFKK